MRMFSGNKDDYRKEVVPPLPLSFDRVMEGRSPQSAAPLLKLPFEILGAILQHVEPASLASLALASRDCRQLARSRQFASVQLDYSDSGQALIVALKEEGLVRANNKGSTLLPSLGACIRRITVATHPGWVSHRHDISLDEDFAALDEKVRNARLALASDFFFDTYVPAIGRLLSDRDTLPHLELLDWEDRIVLPRSFFVSLVCSSIKHLKLFRVQVEEEFKIELPGALATCKWPLQTLHLELSPTLCKRKEISTSTLCNSILRLCAPTLESLTWASLWGDSSYSFSTGALDPPCFPNLRNLKLDRILFSDSSVLNALIQDNLRSLDADTESKAVCADFFQSRGTIPALETFVWRVLRLPASHPLNFLRANTQLSKLSLPYKVPDIFLEIDLLPLLSSSFKRLTSLCLKWEGSTISESALDMISSISTLEQIHLSAGEEYGWKHDWLINHNSMRRYLRKLFSLQKIAFTRDTYLTEMPWSVGNSYYVDRYVRDEGDVSDLDSQHRIWELRHRKRMLGEANEYARVLPKLKWLYCGQLVMGIEEVSEAGEREAVALSHERDSCWTLLQGMFELGA